jgi:endo-alpha-1,4-polygalactosaminidase (GH114 family)
MTTLMDLLPALIDKSREGKIGWEQLSSTSFIARVGELGIEVAEVQNNTFVRLRREDGAVIDSIDYVSTQRPTDQMIKQVYEQARRKGLHIDETIDDLKKALDSL